MSYLSFYLSFYLRDVRFLNLFNLLLGKLVRLFVSAEMPDYPQVNKNCGHFHCVRRPLNFPYPWYRTFAGNDISNVDQVTVRHPKSVIRSMQAN